MEMQQGMDLSDIKLVIQWKATCDLCTLWQRFGRVARGTGQEGTAILLVEKKDIYEERGKQAQRAAKKKEKNRAGIGIKDNSPTSKTPGSQRSRMPSQ